MSEILRADIGQFNGTTFIPIVPAPTEGVYVIPPGGFVFVNADNASRIFEIEIRKGDLSVKIFDDTLVAGEPYAWPFIITLTPDLSLHGRVTTSPTTEPIFYYEGSNEQ